MLDCLEGWETLVFFSIWAVMEAEMFMINTVSVTKDMPMIMSRAAAMLFLKLSTFSLMSNMPENLFSLSVFVYLSVFHFNAVLSVELSKKSSPLFLSIVRGFCTGTLEQFV